MSSLTFSGAALSSAMTRNQVFLRCATKVPVEPVTFLMKGTAPSAIDQVGADVGSLCNEDLVHHGGWIQPMLCDPRYRRQSEGRLPWVAKRFEVAPPYSPIRARRCFDRAGVPHDGEGSVNAKDQEFKGNRGHQCVHQLLRRYHHHEALGRRCNALLSGVGSAPTSTEPIRPIHLVGAPNGKLQAVDAIELHRVNAEVLPDVESPYRVSYTADLKTAVRRRRQKIGDCGTSPESHGRSGLHQLGARLRGQALFGVKVCHLRPRSRALSHSPYVGKEKYGELLPAYSMEFLGLEEAA